MDRLEVTHRPLLEAVSFAARAHQGQLRKDRRTPYASHPFRVCLVVRHVFGIDDPATLTAAVLHDTVEDTPTDFDDLAERFGPEVARWVGLLSKDMRLPEPEREQAYRAALAAAPWQVKVCKLGDIFDNLLDSGGLSPERLRRTFRRSHDYLAVLDDPALPPAGRQAYRTVAALLEELEGRPA
jgi:guanosine-3',5'-bis(diphosphate) 3'-pyrophosphohydrolase